MDKETVPEIMRCSISTVILQMLSIGITNVSKFDFLDPPPQDAVEGALRQLHLLGKEPSLYYASKRTGWVGLENGQFC